MPHRVIDVSNAPLSARIGDKEQDGMDEIGYCATSANVVTYGQAVSWQARAIMRSDVRYQAAHV
jgi:hypothetical protein